MISTNRDEALIDRYRAVWSRIGLSHRLVAERNLPLFEEADALELAEVSTKGQHFHLTAAAADAWRAMRAAADRDGVEIYIVSGYRSVEHQADLIRRKLSAGHLLEDVLKVLAPPGCSEHHTGKAIDVGAPGAQPLQPDFDRSPAFAWLSAHAHPFGFKLSFPQGNAFGYLYEPWHWCFSEPGGPG